MADSNPLSSMFSGTQQQAPTYSTTSTETPKWMQDAIYNQIYQATNVASAPYQEYTGQRVAGSTPYQQAAYQQVADNQGIWQPALQTAQEGMLGIASGPGGYSAAQPYAQQAAGMSGVSAAQPYLQSGLNTNALQTAQPYLNAQSGALGGLQFNAPGETLNPYVQQSLAQSGLSAAQPYMQQAGQSSVANIQDYMNPYTQNVTDQIAKLGARNLSENLLPGVSDAFIKAGGFGGSRMGEFGSRALRDTQESILNQQAQALQAGYGQALGASSADLGRQAQLASQAGSLGTAQQQATLQGGQALTAAQQQAIQQQMTAAGQYGSMAGQVGGLTQAQQQALMSAGSTMGNLTQAQQQALMGLGQQAGTLSQADIARQQSALGQLATMASQGQSMALTDSAALEAAGKAQQGQSQAQLDSAYNQWLASQNYPKQQLDWLSTQVRGMAPITPQQSYTSGTQTSYGASPLSQLASAGAAYAGLNSSGLFK